MKADKFYSRRLMHEAMRQIKLPGIIGVVLLSGVSFFSAIIKLFDARGYNSNLVSYNFMDVNSYIMLVMYVLAPVMVMMLFGFMNRRRASDFYHSLSYPRVCMYTSFLTAVILWCVIIIAIGSLVTIAIISASHGVQLDKKTTLFTIVSAISGCVLTASATALAMTLTGTYLTNVIVALLILFVPRGIMLICNRLFTAALPFVVLTGNDFFGNERNIPFAFVAEVLGYGMNGRSMFSSLIPALYSIVISLIYAGIGAICFTKRKSENATQASVNRGLQCILRMIPAIMISLVAVSVLFDAHTSMISVSDSDKFIVVMAYVAAAAAYFIYEIITTRRIRKIYRTIPGLLVVFAASMGIYFSLIFSYDYNLSQMPDASDLSYVVIHGPEDNVFWQDTEDVKLYSETVRSAAGDCLKDTVNLWMSNKSGTKGFYNQFYSGSMVVEYHYMSGKSITRKVIVNEARYAQLQRALVNESSFASNFAKSVLDSENIIYDITNIDSDADGAKDVYDTFIAEAKTKGVSKLFEIIDDRRRDDSFFQIGLLRKNGRMYSTAYIGVDMPLTLISYMNEINAQYNGNECERFVSAFEAVKKGIDSDEQVDGAYLRTSIDFCLYTVLPDGSLQRNNAYGYAYYDDSSITLSSDKSVEDIDKLGKILERRKINSTDLKPGAMLLYVQYYDDRQIPTIYYDDSSYSVAYTSDIFEDNADYGWYVVDAEVAQLIKNISVEEVVYIEQ